MSSPVRLRPLTVGEILDGAFSLYRRHFRRFFGAALAAQLLPIAVWGVYLALVSAGRAGLEATGDFTRLANVLERLAGVPATAACIWLASGAVLGDDLSVRSAYRVAFRRFWPLLGGGILYTLAIGLGLLVLVVPGLIAAAALFAYPQAIILEGRGPSSALSRSGELTRGARGRCLGVLTILFLAMVTPAIAFYGVAWLVPGMEVGANGAWLSAHAYGIEGIVLGVLLSLGTPLFAIGTTLLYYDRRVRVEAFDLADTDAAPEAASPAEPVPA